MSQGEQSTDAAPMDESPILAAPSLPNQFLGRDSPSEGQGVPAHEVQGQPPALQPDTQPSSNSQMPSEAAAFAPSTAPATGSSAKLPFEPMLPTMLSGDAEVQGADPSPATDATIPSSNSGSTNVSAELLKRLDSQLGELVRLRARDIDVIDRLHAENQRLRGGEFIKSVTPLHNALLRLHDQMVGDARNQADADQKTSKAVTLYAEHLAQILDFSAGLQTVDPEPGSPFDPSVHAGVGIRPTADASAVNTIAATVKPGFRRSDGTIARVAEVEVYQMVVPASTPASNPQNPT